ncbi:MULTISPECIES: hypothetical protein [Deinococcus]|jgi:hypothetical protein|uniref:Lipoprotein n=1 Tax=Deinococcus radiodurans (strain ATCC 13939 / DSM 20539 / JCM 16871 / CCUG 27074 / LMG 4051 / NBRC 15346 / NCIMB 9279 / VKM B-1422 / R1) TaxID=243230 RepID=Q9RSF7_DEIRA|nr:hypothetical protein [Deinococcus radiodurans]AAF11721.1 hypothetical protein DR_2167 [Deinococcus radiodurans R1 = ATCC 13939 = DSM 20539]ANC70771.1 hypothetical protein A2G07_02770 [Deinococcus radiodurans R1 = ATCC 13939 = DSM 20539]QEM71553.1 hypothetical protein DXG80_07105 [Deinococcus radiodurans]QIP27871.1 hypothetical protein HAV23_00480 [Deinococcus radiodurans]QIP31249.1 hypothetical protein HAV35_03035 [Deinococcus radiodurans]
MKRVFALFLTLGLGSSALACTPAQSAQNVRAAAQATVSQRMNTAALVYGFMYSNVRHDVHIGTPTIRGQTATVRGTLNIRATERASGKAVQGSYPGTVTLNKVGTCGWRVTGYKQD